MSDSDQSNHAPRLWRQMSAEFRQSQLIDATIDVIAEVGIANTTVSKVAKRAGLSAAVINLQFGSKQNLLIETFNKVRFEFQQCWKEVMATDEAQLPPAQKIRELLNVYFRPGIYQPKKLKVWFAFVGSAPVRNSYIKITDGYDHQIVGGLSEVVEQLPEMVQPNQPDPKVVARSLLATCDGLWLAGMLRPHTLSAAQCMDTIDVMLQLYFPNHFTPI